MAAPTLTLLTYTDIADADSLTNWGGVWGSAVIDTLEPDIKKEGTNSVTGAWRLDAAADGYEAASAPITAVGKTFRAWINTINLPYMDTEANGGYELLISDGTTTEYLTLFGSDTYPGGWFNIVADMDQFTTVTLANVDRWGIRIQHTASAKNIDNVWLDAFKYMDGYSMTGGTAIDPILMSDIAVADAGTTTLFGYGIVEEIQSVYICTGDIQFGTGATTAHITLDGDIILFADKPVAAGLYKLSGVGSGTTVIITDCTITADGATDATRYIFDFDETNLSSLTCTGNFITRAGASFFKSGQTVTGNIFNDCGQITHGGADMDDCIVKNYEGTANTSALIYNINADPDGEMDGMQFIKGTAATHAIEFGTTSPLTMTLRDINFSGYNASNAQNDSTFHVKRTTGTVTINLVGCTGNFSYRTDGAIVNLVSGAVNVKVTAVETDGTPIQNANVILEASDGTGPFPYQDSVTITRAGTVATVTHTAHGMATGDKVKLRGITDKKEDNSGVHTITVTGANTYTYVTTDAGSTSYTGTITSTFVALAGLTDINGEISVSRVYSLNQPVVGSSRKNSASPYFIAGILTGTVSSTLGFDGTAVMVLDE